VPKVLDTRLLTTKSTWNLLSPALRQVTRLLPASNVPPSWPAGLFGVKSNDLVNSETPFTCGMMESHAGPTIVNRMVTLEGLVPAGVLTVPVTGTEAAAGSVRRTNNRSSLRKPHLA
jgi:hypothetical protein